MIIKTCKNRLILSLILGVLIFSPLFGVEAATNLSGRILLQVQDKGQAWYVSPLNYQRYYLGTPAEAYNLMRQLGLGISNKDFVVLNTSVPNRLVGRILIKVEDFGKAYYVDPLDRRLYYLGRPADAFSVMRNRGLGITNSDLAKITIASGNQASSTNLEADQKKVLFSWKYKNKDYSLEEVYSNSLYNQYVSSSKILTYPSNNPPLNPQEDFYSIFISAKKGDDSIDKLISDLKAIASREGYQGDELLEFILAFIQYIPYDFSKLSGERIPNFPYETLYKNSGVCSDKSFLAKLILQRLNYGAVIFEFPEVDHNAVGVECPIEDSSYGSGYCYFETTNYFPIGVFPQSLNSGVASSGDYLDKAFDPSNLGKVDYYQKTKGQIYGGLAATKIKIETIRGLRDKINAAKLELAAGQSRLDVLELNLNSLKAQLDAYLASNNISQYNLLIPSYNQAISEYNTELSNYQAKIDSYNSDVSSYNQLQKTLFQN